MSDRWEYYPCQMGDRIAFVFVNMSVGERLAESGRTGQVLARVKLKHPREDGLTTEEEVASLSALEDGFSTYCATAAADIVGRVTVGGIRDFAVYADDAEQVAHGLRTIAEDEHGYEIECLVRDDPEFEVYWSHLYPSPLDQHLIQNRELVERLEAHGDPCTEPRRIHHWAYFDAAEDRRRFEERVVQDGFIVEGRLEPNEDHHEFGLQFGRQDTPELAAVNESTVALFGLAEEFGGEYDGWETTVHAPDGADA